MSAALPPAEQVVCAYNGCPRTSHSGAITAFLELPAGGGSGGGMEIRSVEVAICDYHTPAAYKALTRFLSVRHFERTPICPPPQLS